MVDAGSLSTELTELELEMAIHTIGVLWPIHPTIEHVVLPKHKRAFNRLPETMFLLNFVITQGGWRVQASALASVIAILTKVSPRQTTDLLSRLSSPPPLDEQVGVRDLATRLRRALDNTKNRPVRQHAMAAIAALLNHSS
ncbi:unnamed protein product [Protopolystoma xenopodis]|uniref:Uncharacterized protein n=1 Tax=Protopolystoma xenopodis TaxID=117903 RepID=A0A3S5B006_9PLAT|nr:unnamed protein product [Protopolystoma xenopodis]